jgi:hypothetical protein
MPISSPRGRTLFRLNDLLITTGVSLAYLILSYLLVGFKSDQIVLILIFNGFYYSSEYSRKFILGFAIFIVYWIIFDYMKAMPNYTFNDVHIVELHNLEKSLFSIKDGTVALTPNDYFARHHKVFIDVISGFFYLMWIPVPLVFAAFLFFKNRLQFLYFSLTFVLVNLMGFVIYYVYPAAPPWYFQLHGDTFISGTPGNTAGLGRFDAFFNAPVFASIYSKSSNVFAAMPSLHSSYPVIVLYYGLRNKLGLFNIFFLVVMLGIWFTAVYTSHHYILDVIAGICCAIIGIYVFNHLADKKTFNRLLQRYAKRIQ